MAGVLSMLGAYGSDSDNDSGDDGGGNTVKSDNDKHEDVGEIEEKVKEKEETLLSRALKRVTQAVESAPDIRVSKKRKRKAKLEIQFTPAIEVEGVDVEDEGDDVPEQVDLSSGRGYAIDTAAGGLTAFLPAPKRNVTVKSSVGGDMHPVAADIDEMKPKPKSSSSAMTIGAVQALKAQARRAAAAERESRVQASQVQTESALESESARYRAMDMDGAGIATTLASGAEAVPDPIEAAPSRFFNGVRMTHEDNMMTVNASDLVDLNAKPELTVNRGRVAGDGQGKKTFTQTQRSRHQISWLLSDLREHEAEYDERLAAGIRTKKETWGKYGWS